jgi:ribosome biogenesis GTPase / thiamine phosphate phosphatase
LSEIGHGLERIGFGPFFADQMAALDAGLVPARIAIAHGESYVAWTEAGVGKAVIAGRRLAEWQTPADRPQVGDWVAGAYSPQLGALLIDRRLARRTCLVRQAAANPTELQVIAANVDVVGIVSALGDGDAKHERWLVNEDRLRRYLASVEQSGARPLLVLNKCDLHRDPGAVAARLGEAFPGVPIVALSGAARTGLEGLRPWLGAGETLVLVGMSGVGKSTLVNALLGRDAQRVGSVRESDDRGRHTTSHRELFAISGGAFLIDTPGMREMSVWDDDAARRHAAQRGGRGRSRRR